MNARFDIVNARVGLLAAALLVLAACGGDDTGPASIRTDSAGIEIVLYPGGDVPSPLTFVEELRLGGSDSDPTQSFYQVYGGTVGADASGNLYVLDSAGNRVVVFDADGRFVRQMGRAGGGPGEIGMPGGLVVSEDGTAGVIDFSKRAFVRFDPAGEPLSLEPTPRGYFGGPLRLMRGTMMVQIQQPVGDQPPTTTLVRIAGGDTTLIAFTPPVPTKPIRLESCGMGFSGMPPLFSPTLRWAAQDGRTAVVTGAAYDVSILEDGREVRRIRRDVSPTPATEELAMRQVGDAMQVRTEGGVRRCEPADVVGQQGYAQVIPAVSAVALSPDGRLWVAHGGVQNEPAAIDIFGPDGAYEGTLPPGTPFPLLFLPDGRIAAAEEDDVGVRRLVVYSVDGQA